MKTLFAVTGTIEMLTGVALILAPSPPAKQIFGVSLDSSSEKTLPTLGVVLLALGLAFWRARDDFRSPAGRGLAVALLVYNTGFAALLASGAMGSSGSALGLWPAFGIHAGLAVWGAWALRASSRPAAARG
jgi:hypothetical protein